ncbi:lysylphosphatidylglycerol synthase transmembrane domain-containing protein [Salinibacter sp.]|uniref:lysylphosphatidylglycerol synthase transmembrane domain-containing protein n=1 Tax=Salinibacter sp. TaxID=2065818 RepID=UPI0021E981C2|nr:lysylphosphatidylglycerol synthase transmembrane domain-containing protein [Salinibacter sp.]
MKGESKQTFSRKQLLTAVAGIAVSVAVLGWALYQVDLRKAVDVLGRFGPWWAAPMLLCYLSSFLVRGVRWRLLLQPVETVSWPTSTGVIFSGYMANNLLPLRLGEIVRALVLGQVTSARVEGTLSTIVLERVFDGLVLVGMIALVLASGIGPEAGGVVAYTGAVSALVFVGALFFVVGARLFPRPILSGVRWTLSCVPIIEEERGLDATRSLLRGLKSLALDQRLLAVIGLSAAVWILEGGMFWVGLWAFSLDAGVEAAFLTLAFVNLSILVPSAPGYVGIFQGATILAFGAFGLSEEVALSYSVVVHFLQYVSVTVIGLAVLAAYGVSLTALRRQSMASEYTE